MRIVLDLQGAQSDSRFRGIGRYSLALARAIAREAKQHEVWLALSGRFPDSIEPLRSGFADLIPPECIRIFELPGPVAELDLANTWRTKAAELLREKFLADLRPDIVHVLTLFEGLHNEVVASVGRLDTRVPTAVTLYDLIPLLRPESYLTDEVKRRYYLRRAQSLKRADLVLAISESSRREAVEKLHIPSSRVVNIAAGVQPWFWPIEISPEIEAELAARVGLDRPFMLFTGGTEPRKNLERLITAFGLLPAHLRTRYQLAVTGHLNQEERNRIISFAREKGLARGDVAFIGYASDDDLRSLYTSCTLFVFPSVHEGFGLPVVEAMACGAPVIGSNCSSIPEIINREDALFDPKEPREIADRMAAVLSSVELRESLKAWGLERAKTFTWEASARHALRAFEELHAKRNNSLPIELSSILQHRPRLAFVGPLPPVRSGIAGYCAKLLPELARHYEVVCIVDQQEVTEPRITAEFPIRDVSWFEVNAQKFERVVYHFGNSEFHKHMFVLLEKQPGVVILHDFYLSAVLDWMEAVGYAHGSFTKALCDSHGFSALEYDHVNGRKASTAAFPCNASVLRDSIGVIVHSSHAIEVARTWYGDRAAAAIRQVPFLPFAPEPTERGAARRRLGLSENAFVVCSFGFVAPTKLNDRLLEAWLASAMGRDEECSLIFVGENEGGDYGKQLSDRIAASRGVGCIRITGYVDESQYRDYLAAADLAVQLRAESRGETSAAVFDCLARGVPLIINAHGSAAELPKDVVTMLDDSFTDRALSSALERLYADTDARETLASRGALYLNKVHHPERIAELYWKVIEELYATSSRAQEQRLVQAIANTSAPAQPTDDDLVAVAMALTTNRERFGPPQILIDVTNVAKSDLRTGIERVTRAILMALLADPPPGYRIEPVRATTDGYLYARRFTSQCLALPANALKDDPVEVGHEDIFIGLDWCADVTPSLKRWLLAQRWRGTRVVFVAYDLLPLLHPEFFPPYMAPITLDWISAVAETADGIVCISRTVADELYQWLTDLKPKRFQSLSLGFFHLGADLRSSLPTKGQSKDGPEVLAKLLSRPTIMMVGTVEPRKGHRQALAAMEQLWAEGQQINIVIIGKQGWNVEQLAGHIQGHAELGRRLFWLDGISDEMLDQLYRSSCALLAASEAEGFGLPLIEAAQYGLPIIAREIPVFREVAGDCAYYFRGNQAQDLADALRAWLSLGNGAPASDAIPWLTWHQSSRQLLDFVLGKRSYRSWPEAPADSLLQPIAASAESENQKYADVNHSR